MGLALLKRGEDCKFNRQQDQVSTPSEANGEALLWILSMDYLETGSPAYRTGREHWQHRYRFTSSGATGKVR